MIINTINNMINKINLIYDLIKFNMNHIKIIKSKFTLKKINAY